MKLVGPDSGKQLEALIEPQSLAIVASVLAAWAVSHAFGVGEAIDIILGVVGIFSIGLAIFSDLDHLTKFALGAYNAATEADLDRAAHDLSEAIAILGIQAVLAFLFRGRPNVRRIDPGPPPPRTPGARYRPTTTYEPPAPRHARRDRFLGQHQNLDTSHCVRAEGRAAP